MERQDQHAATARRSRRAQKPAKGSLRRPVAPQSARPAPVKTKARKAASVKKSTTKAAPSSTRSRVVVPTAEMEESRMAARTRLLQLENANRELEHENASLKSSLDKATKNAKRAATRERDLLSKLGNLKHVMEQQRRELVELRRIRIDKASIQSLKEELARVNTELTTSRRKVLELRTELDRHARRQSLDAEPQESGIDAIRRPGERWASPPHGRSTSPPPPPPPAWPQRDTFLGQRSRPSLSEAPSQEEKISVYDASSGVRGRQRARIWHGDEPSGQRRADNLGPTRPPVPPRPGGIEQGGTLPRRQGGGSRRSSPARGERSRSASRESRRAGAVSAATSRVAQQDVSVVSESESDSSLDSSRRQIGRAGGEGSFLPARTTEKKLSGVQALIERYEVPQEGQARADQGEPASSPTSKASQNALERYQRLKALYTEKYHS